MNTEGLSRWGGADLSVVTGPDKYGQPLGEGPAGLGLGAPDGLDLLLQDGYGLLHVQAVQVHQPRLPL